MVRLINLLLILQTGFIIPVVQAHMLGLKDLQDMAVASSESLAAMRVTVNALDAESQAAQSLPDPKIGFGLVNVPTGHFELDRENMTQKKIELSQMFPPGRTLSLTSQIVHNQQDTLIWQRKNALLKTKLVVNTVWLDYVGARYTNRLLEAQRQQVQEQVETAKKLLAQNKVQQKDVLRLQVSLDELLQRLTVNESAVNKSKRVLERLVHQPLNEAISEQFPEWIHKDLATVKHVILHHPLLKAAEMQKETAKTEIAVAKQTYWPELGASLSYGFRDKNPQTHKTRSDMVSMMLQFSLPIFMSNKQNNRINAKQDKLQAAEYQRLDKLQELYQELDNTYYDNHSLHQQLSLYEHKILPQTEQVYDSTLTLYQNGNVSVLDVIQASNELLTMKLGHLTTKIKAYKNEAKILYFIGTHNE